MLALDPNETFEVRLETDADAAFVFRYMTVRELRAYRRFGEERAALEAMTADQVEDGLLDRLTGRLHNVRGVAVDGLGETAPIRELLLGSCTVGELWELYYAAQRQSRLTPAEKNGSGSSSPVSTEPCAAPGDAGPDTAPTPPAQ